MESSKYQKNERTDRIGRAGKAGRAGEIGDPRELRELEELEEPCPQSVLLPLFHAQLSTVVGVSWWHVVALVETWNLEDWGNQAQVSSSWLLYIPNDEVWDASCKQAYFHTRHNLVKLVYRA